MTSRGIKPRLLKSDKLGRDILSSKFRRRIKNGRAPSGIFLDNASPTELSVHRLTPVPNRKPPADRPDLAPDTMIAEIGDRRAEALGRNFYGWAELSVADASEQGRAVRILPLPENQWHADIVLPDEARKKERTRRDHAAKLAGKSKWRPRPEGETKSS